jgi:hypothetical protein
MIRPFVLQPPRSDALKPRHFGRFGLNYYTGSTGKGKTWKTENSLQALTGIND